MGARVLVVEDEGGIVDNIAYALKTEGFEHRWCSTGNDALAAIREDRFSIIVLDIGLPDINGLDLFKEIKKLTDVPVIFLTARSGEIDRIVGLELGADDYVSKPFSPRELTARIKAVLRRIEGKQNDSSSESAAGSQLPLILDENKNTVSYYKRKIKVSKYEFGILKLLIKHPGWVYSREKIMEIVWGEPDISLVRTIDAHIKNLRKKMKEIEPDIDPIVTHHGSGYSLKEDW